MNVWVEIDSRTVFEIGDVIANNNERVQHCDGDRASFKPYGKLILRPVNGGALQLIRKQIATKLYRLANELSI